MAEVKPIPDGYPSVIPHLTVKGASDAIEFYKKAFGAQEVSRSTMPDSKSIMHAEIRIGDSPIFLYDQMPEMGAKGPEGDSSPVTMHLYVEDVDALWKQAIAAGAKETMPLMDAFWGDRYGKLVDPFGHHWSLASHIEDVPPEEMEERAKKAFGG